ncbi:LysR family transcriptional regulator [Taklimakanibacter deserti]|uniref:LysR family transcriptional regulator n=1 Tax=Taklimakanibacter deserti TaxID=2267839 RepID=UPI000E648DBD
MSGFDWNDLSYFLELARQGRLMPAAKRLRVDHTTVSRRIAELEKSLDCKLFDRNNSGFALSDAGQRLLSYAESIEANVLAIAQNVSSKPAQISGSVRLGTMEGIASMFLAEHFHEFHQRHPAVLVELLTERHVANLPKRESDILLSFIRPNSPRLVVKKIGEFALRLYASAGYLERRGTPASASDLVNHVFIDYIEDIVIVRETHWLLDVIKDPTVVFRTSSMLAQQHAAANGVGIVLLPAFSGSLDKRLVSVLPDQASPKRDLWLCVHEDLEYIARIKAVMKFVAELVERRQAFLMGNS